MVFFITPGIQFPPTDVLEKMIISAGGIVEKEIKHLHSIKELLPDTYFIISCFEDLQLIKELLHMKKSRFCLNLVYIIIVCDSHFFFFFSHL